MNIINEKIEVLGEVELGAHEALQYGYICYEDGSKVPVIITEKSTGALQKTIAVSYVIEDDFIETFLKPLAKKLIW